MATLTSVVVSMVERQGINIKVVNVRKGKYMLRRNIRLLGLEMSSKECKKGRNGHYEGHEGQVTANNAD